MRWGVPVSTFFEMTEGLSSQSAFALNHYPISEGKVWFFGAGGRKRLQEILDYHNDGVLPSGVMLESYSAKAGSFTAQDLQRSVEDLRGPNDDGYYHGRCPCCQMRGGDTNKDHFYANPDEGKLGCFAGCKKAQLVDAVTKIPEEKDAVSSDSSRLQLLTISQSSERKASGIEIAAEVRARVSGNKVLCESFTKTGESAGTFEVPVGEVQRFAQAMVKIGKKRFTTKELVEELGMDLTTIQGNRSITRVYHPPVKALYGLNEIVYYKNGDIELR